MRSRPATQPARRPSRQLNSALAYAASGPASPLAPITIPRRVAGPRDVVIDIEFCGICHSDVHTARSEWSGTTYPCVPGHEIVGRVVQCGPRVSAFTIGDRAAVGCLVGSCRRCTNCRAGLEQFCNDGATWTYNSPDPKMRGRPTYGGYASRIVVDEHFCLQVPRSLDPAGTAPLLCAGITTYSPLRHWNVGRTSRVGIVGLGGLGHMGLQFAHAFGAETVLFTRSPGKQRDAKRFGADDVVVSTNTRAMRKYRNSLDLILDTVAMPHDLDALTANLRRDGVLVLVGLPEARHPSPDIARLIGKRRSIAGSLVGGIPETQEMLDFCARKRITSEVEVIGIQEVNTAYERMLRSDVRYRFVIDMSSLAPRADASFQR